MLGETSETLRDIYHTQVSVPDSIITHGGKGVDDRRPTQRCEVLLCSHQGWWRVLGETSETLRDIYHTQVRSSLLLMQHSTAVHRCAAEFHKPGVMRICIWMYVVLTDIVAVLCCAVKLHDTHA